MKFAVEKTVDGLGRIVLPKNMRDYYCISLNDRIRLIPTDDGILITKISDSGNEEKESLANTTLK